VQRLPQAGELLSPAPEYWLGVKSADGPRRGQRARGHHLLLSP
jgi:hypothetical protein